MRTTFTFLVLLFMIISAYGQTFIGARAGCNFSKVNGIGTANSSYDWEEGYHCGLALYLNIGDNLYLQPEILYSGRGYNYVKYYSKDKIVAGDTVQLNQNSKLDYLDIPILARLQLGRVYFEAGPQLGIHLGGRKKEVHMLNRNGEIVQVHSTRHSREFIEPIDIGFIAGIGYQTHTGFGIGARYNQGFREVVRRVNWEKNVLLQVSGSYIIGYSAFMKAKSNSALLAADFQYEYFDPAKVRSAKKKEYKITTKQNVLRFNIVKMGESVRPEVQYVFNSMGSRNQNSVLISGSSGVEVQTPLFTGFRDIEFPFKGVIRYSTPTSVGVGSVESILEFEINAPGIWRVNIMTQ